MPVSNVNLSPTDYSVEAQAIERRRKLAELMQQQSIQPLESPPTSGGWAVPISPLSGLAKMLQGYAGGRGMQQADERQLALAARIRAQAQQQLGAMPQGTPEMPAQTTGELGTVDELNTPAKPATEPTRQQLQAWALGLAGSGNPISSPIGTKLAEAYLKPPTFRSAAPGSVPLNTATGELGTTAVPQAPQFRPVTTASPTGTPQTEFFDMRNPPKTPLAQPAPQQAPSNLARLQAELAALPAGDPRRPQYETAITHLTNPQSQRISVSTGDRAAYTNVQPDGQGGFIGLSKKTGQMEKIPQGEGAIGGGQLSGDALELAAARYKLDGTLPTNLGRGQQGATNTVKILARAAELAKESGDTPEATRITQIANKASTTALAQLQKQETMVGAFERTFNKNADLATQWSTKVDRTGVPIVNKWIQAGKRAITGDPDLVAYDAIIKGVANEYTKIISGSMGNMQMAEQEIKRVEGLLSAAQTPKQVNEVVAMMKRETQNRMTGFHEQRAELMKTFQGRRAGDYPAAANVLKFDAQGNQIK